MGEKTAAKLVNEYGDLDTLFAHLDALSPKLRENLADHAEQVRTNAEVIPLVRDVPLDVHVDDLTLGGWDLDEAREIFAEFELRSLWTRFTAADGRGRLRAAGRGSGDRRSGGEEPAPTGSAHRRSPAGGAGESPEWLTSPEVVVPATPWRTPSPAVERRVRRRPPRRPATWPCSPAGPGTRAARRCSA